MKHCHAFEFNDYKMVPDFIWGSMPETLGFALILLRFLNGQKPGGFLIFAVAQANRFSFYLNR